MRLFSNSFNDRKNFKFDSFRAEGTEAKDYSVKDDWKTRMTALADDFVGKPETERLPFDPNVRHNMDEINNDLIYRAINQLPPRQEAQSCYLSIMHKGRRYHLFDASRIPLGRMARMCAVFIRGKNKPTYDSSSPELQGDVCVIVNAKKPLIWGKKLHQKKYRHHTGYFSGLKTITMEKLLEKDAQKVVYFAVKGMLPKNKLREDLLKKMLIVHDGPYHTQYAYMLPQFTQPTAIDINDEFDLNDVTNKDKFEIVFEKDPTKTPEEFKDMDRNIDEELSRPLVLRDEKTHVEPKENIFMGVTYRKNWKHMKRHKDKFKARK